MNNKLKIITLNLHGYHPMYAPIRYIYKSNNFLPVSNDVYYFTEKEIINGNNKRIEKLANDIANQNIDIYLFQEVAAGFKSDLSQQKFYNEFFVDDEIINSGNYSKNHPIFKLNNHFSTNTLIRLKHHLLTKKIFYNSILLCRGNIGWISGNQIKFYGEPSDIYIKKDNQFFKILDKDKPPFPDGLLIEGFGILTKSDILLVNNTTKKIPIFGTNDSFSAQLITFLIKRKKINKRLVVCNVHLGHKLFNLEQQASIRIYLENYLLNEMLNNNLLRFNETLSECYKRNYIGTIIGGDFNAISYEANPNALDIGFYPFFQNNFSFDQIKEKAYKFNYANYKKFASTSDNFFYNLFERLEKYLLPLLKKINENRAIINSNFSDPLAFLNNKNNLINANDERIDYLLTDHNGINADNQLKIIDAKIIWNENDWIKTDGVSDHKGLFAEFEILN